MNPLQKDLVKIIQENGLRYDTDSQYCLDIITYVALYTRLKDKPVVCYLPDSFDEYYDSCASQARYEYRRAEKRGYVAQKAKPPHKEVIEIFKSKAKRQGRDINMVHHNIYGGTDKFTDKWVEEDYTKYTCPNHYVDFWVCGKDKTVAFAEILHCGDYVITRATMGHANCLKDGIMKYMFINIIKDSIEKGRKYFNYGTKPFLEDERRHFVNQLGINQTK